MELEQPTSEVMEKYGKAVAQVLPDTRKEETPIHLRVITVISDFTGVPKEDMEKKGRLAENVQARQFAMYFIKAYSNNTLKRIGIIFGDRDHSTVLHAIETVNNQREVDKNYRKLFEEIEVKVKEIL